METSKLAQLVAQGLKDPEIQVQTLPGAIELFAKVCWKLKVYDTSCQANETILIVLSKCFVQLNDAQWCLKSNKWT